MIIFTVLETNRDFESYLIGSFSTLEKAIRVARREHQKGPAHNTHCVVEHELDNIRHGQGWCKFSIDRDGESHVANEPSPTKIGGELQD